MTARVLVVDDILANVKLFEARLTAEYFDVRTAMNGREALELCQENQFDIILLDVMMPGMDGFEVCQRLKSDPHTMHIPVIMVTALDQAADRVRGLEAGADDFLTKPVSDLALITRVRNLVRLKMLTDELRMRALTGNDLGIDPIRLDNGQFDERGRILVVDDRKSSRRRICSILEDVYDVESQSDPALTLMYAVDGQFDLIVISMVLHDHDSLRLCSRIRSLERTRTLPILVTADIDDHARLMRALEIGVNDYLRSPIDPNELLARVATQIRRKRYNDFLRSNVQHTMEMALTDALTGLYNRRYLENHLNTLVAEARSSDKALSLLIVDIDFFKAINDTHGHDIGDEILKEFARRLQAGVRGVDLAVRYGGEEFVVAMPDADLSMAYLVGERLRLCIANEPFAVQDGQVRVNVTISVGLATLMPEDTASETLLKRADQALYVAKRDGRNRVAADAA